MAHHSGALIVDDISVYMVHHLGATYHSGAWNVHHLGLCCWLLCWLAAGRLIRLNDVYPGCCSRQCVGPDGEYDREPRYIGACFGEARFRDLGGGLPSQDAGDFWCSCDSFM